MQRELRSIASAGSRREILDLRTILGGIRNPAHSRYWNYQREGGVKARIHEFEKGARIRTRNSGISAPTRERGRRKISAPERISRQIGAFVSPTFIFRNRARHPPRYCRCKSDITSDIVPVYIPPDIFRTTNILAGFYEASTGEAYLRRS